jgi:hypothetical protein
MTQTGVPVGRSAGVAGGRPLGGRSLLLVLLVLAVAIVAVWLALW